MHDTIINDLRVALVSGGDQAQWDRFAAGGKVEVLPRATVHVLIKLPTYACYYPRLRVDGGAGACVRCTYAEAPSNKGDREHAGGKPINGLTDILLADGGNARILLPLWWRSGVWFQTEVQTAEEEIELSGLELRETRYPLSFVDPTRVDDTHLADLATICRRTLETCCHETYMDCPHYEQLMYAGDARLQRLTTYAQSSDARPAIKALRMIESSRANFNQLPTHAAPGDAKFIPTFALQWIGMVHDFAVHHDQPSVLRSMLPGVRSVLDRFWENMHAGLLRSLAGWSFVDWAADPFQFGVPQGGELAGLNATINLSLLIAIDHASDLELYVGEKEMASLYSRRADELTSRIAEEFLDPTRSVLRETPGMDTFTEHVQSLAVLSCRFEGKFDDFTRHPLLVRCSPYFTHCVFEALYRLHQAEAFFATVPVANGILMSCRPACIHLSVHQFFQRSRYGLASDTSCFAGTSS